MIHSLGKTAINVIFAVLVVTIAVLFWHTCLKRGGIPVVRPILQLDRVEPYREEYSYRIPRATTWRQTGEDIGVPTVEPADEATRQLVEDVLGIDPDEYEFVWVGEVGALPHGADISVGRPRAAETVAEADADVDFSGLPRGVALPPRPLEMILRARPAPPPPLFDLRSLHRFEVGPEWTPSGEQRWSLEYRPWSLWIRDKGYITGDVGVVQQGGEASVYGAIKGGVYLGREKK